MAKISNWRQSNRVAYKRNVYMLFHPNPTLNYVLKGYVLGSTACFCISNRHVVTDKSRVIHQKNVKFCPSAVPKYLGQNTSIRPNKFLMFKFRISQIVFSRWIFTTYIDQLNRSWRWIKRGFGSSFPVLLKVKI